MTEEKRIKILIGILIWVVLIAATLYFDDKWDSVNFWRYLGFSEAFIGTVIAWLWLKKAEEKKETKLPSIRDEIEMEEMRTD